MLIVCPTCAATYDVAPDRLGASGRSVRCVRCRTVWFANAPGEQATAVIAPNGDSIGPPQPVASTLRELMDWEAAARAAAPRASPADAHAAWQSEETPASGPIPPADSPPAAAERTAFDPPADPTPNLPALAGSDAPSLVPAEEMPGPVEPAAGATVDALANPDIETLAARRVRRPGGTRKKRGSWRPGLPSVIMVLFVILAGLVVARNQVVRIAPQTASLFSAIGLAVNVRGLALEKVKTRHEVHDGAMVLIVEGTVANVTRAIVEVPRLRFALRNPAGLEIYAWTAVAGRPALGPGESTTFSSRLASPPTDAREVIVRFLTRRDLTAGER
jgi:predicted Zn finger-like uncharacterized protein